MSSDPAMLGPDAFPRTLNDCYPTIDERCVAHLNKVWPLKGIHFTEPAAGYGHMMRQLESHGAICDEATDLVAYPGADPRIISGVNIFTDPPMNHASTIITNLPFDVLQDLTRVLLDAHHGWIILLTRASQLHVQGMRELMRGRIYAAAPLPFRPKWFPIDHERRHHGPRHEYTWLFFQPVHHRRQQPLLLLHSPPMNEIGDLP